MEIVHVAAECYPVAKAGGLGDVVGALPKYQTELGHWCMKVANILVRSFFIIVLLRKRPISWVLICTSLISMDCSTEKKYMAMMMIQKGSFPFR